MPELGEPIATPDFVQDDVHSESTCPWHDKSEPPAATAMDPAADDEDCAAGEVLAPMAANNGHKLGVNLGDKDNTKIQVNYPGSSAPTEEDLQWAPHHLIPGNASLKRSAVVPYLGDDDVIAKFGSGSKIKKGDTVGYDVNSADNGVWLPSPYALSMKGKWPKGAGSKTAYVVAAIDSTGGRSQFHMCHSNYSTSVRDILEEIGSKLKGITQAVICKEAKPKEADKFSAPLGLKGRLNSVSSQLRTVLSGPVWQPPFVDDTQNDAYLAAKSIQKKLGLKAAVQALKLGTK
jgi:hypothetical protein